ncbi:MAG: hypothetical protein ABI761_14235 [Saprospiraceae bacterium]
MAALSLRKAIEKEQSQGVNPAIIVRQLQIIKGAKPINQKQIEDFLHGKPVTGLKLSDIKAYQQLAIFRINNQMALFPYKLNLNDKDIHTFY